MKMVNMTKKERKERRSIMRKRRRRRSLTTARSSTGPTASGLKGIRMNPVSP